ncbi:hypothetical protein SIID45300_01679 [Candidatus Magnetaquicoccaceae bacterium FCR-1]|uniref:Uncharacterized protein n=1 Tax=Candidatus Magnetaquiglobus chichijimensis TaxID=3141448 RepID=A0ABQ0C8Y3_9PROT
MHNTPFESEQQSRLQEMATLLGNITDATPLPSPQHPQTLPHFLRALLLTAFAGVLLAVGSWPLHQQQQPITDQQHAILTALVEQVVSHSGHSHQKIWSSLHKRFEIRRARHLKRGDFDDALGYLSNAMSL